MNYKDDDPWNGDIHTARESDEGDTLHYDKSTGNEVYDNSGTYGQDDFTVRERKSQKGTWALYVESDSDDNHSHDVIDKDGNLVDTYHDYLIKQDGLLDNVYDENEISTINKIKKKIKRIKF